MHTTKPKSYSIEVLSVTQFIDNRVKNKVSARMHKISKVTGEYTDADLNRARQRSSTCFICVDTVTQRNNS